MARRAASLSMKSARQTSPALCAVAARPGKNHRRRTHGASTRPTAAANFRAAHVLRSLVRRAFFAGLAGAAAWPLAGRAQQIERLRRVGALMQSLEKNPTA